MMINSGDFASLEALRHPDAARHYTHAASAIQYRAGTQIRHFWPPTPPPDGRYGSGSGGRPPSVMMPPAPQPDIYFEHLHHKAYLATPPPLESAGHFQSAFSMYGGSMPPKSEPRKEVKRYPLPPAPSSKPVPIHHHHHQQPSYRHPSVIVKQEVADDEAVQPTNLVVHKSSRPPNNKFIHSIHNSPFSPPAPASQSALSSLQTLVEQNGCPKLKHPPPVGCVLPMPSNPLPASRHPLEPKKSGFPCSADAPGNIPIGIAHAHQRPKDLTCDPIDVNPSPLKSHLLSKPPPQPLSLIRDFKEECLEKPSFPPYGGPVVPHHLSGVMSRPGSRWPWLPPVWPPAPEGCQLVKDPRTGHLLLLETAGSYALMAPPTTSNRTMWTPYPQGSTCCDYKTVPKIEKEIDLSKTRESLAIIKKEIAPSPPAEVPAKPVVAEVIDLTITTKEEEEEEEEEKEEKPPPDADGLQLLLDGIEIKKSPSSFEFLCSYAHDMFEKEQTTPPPPKLTPAQRSAEVTKKVQSQAAVVKPDPDPIDAPESSELKIRQQLADLQRKYQENQRSLAELAPKKRTSKHKPNRPKKNASALESPKQTTIPTKAAVKQMPASDTESDVPLSRLCSKPAATAETPVATNKLKRTLSNSFVNLPKSKKNAASGTPKKNPSSGTDSPPNTEVDTPPKKEPKPKAVHIKSEKGQQKSPHLVRKRKFIRPKRHSTPRLDSREAAVDKVSRNLFTKSEANDNNGEEEEVKEEEPSFEKRLRTKSKKKADTSKARLSKTQASISICKQLGQQKDSSPEKRDKQTIVKRTRLSLVRRQSTNRLQRSNEDNTNASTDTPTKRGLRKEEDTCLLRDQDVVENTRVLVLEDGLLYPGVIIDIQPPKVYGVVLDGGRGTSPRLFSREELAQQAVQEVKPSKLLPEGSRVCAYWSQHYQCLYPGVVSKGENGGSPDGKSMFVQFDDGDSGKIPFCDIRLLASRILDPSSRSRTPSPAPPEPVESPRTLRKKKKKQTLASTKPPGVEKKKKASLIRPSLRLRLSRALRQRSSPGYHHFYHRSRMATTASAVTPKVESSPSNTTDNGSSLWRWCGKPFRKIGAKGKTRREYFRAIIRKNEKIVVGECVVFCGRNSPQVGRVQNLWQTCTGGSMVVRVRWFYLPQELKNSTPHMPKGGLFQSSHEEDNDVQSISHKCQVMSYEEYCQKSQDVTDSVYYLAGDYDLSSGTLSPLVEC